MDDDARRGRGPDPPEQEPDEAPSGLPPEREGVADVDRDPATQEDA